MELISLLMIAVMLDLFSNREIHACAQASESHVQLAEQSGEQSQISWAYYPKVVRINEIVRSVSTFLTTVKCVHLHWERTTPE